MAIDFKLLQEELGISFRNKSLLIQAFTHSSYVNEHKYKNLQDNERLEFLGDAVLELGVSEHLFKLFPNLKEGQMTKLRAATVCESSLVNFANKLNFGDYILLGKGEELTGGRNRPALLADVFESFIGALYLDQGLDAVRAFLDRYVFPKLEHLEDGDFSQFNDYKSMLQEYVQHENIGNIYYHVVDEKGPAHDREFHSEVLIENKFYGSGVGKSKKDSEQKAAHQALKKLGVIKD